MEELKPCPFCGSPKIRKSDASTNPHFTYCDGCGAICYWHLKDMYNTRATDKLIGEIAEKIADSYCKDMLMEEMARAETHLLANPAGVEEWQDLAMVMKKYNEQRGIVE